MARKATSSLVRPDLRYADASAAWLNPDHSEWNKCSHPWHFNFKWNGERYRFSLERHVGRIARDC